MVALCTATCFEVGYTLGTEIKYTLSAEQHKILFCHQECFSHLNFKAEWMLLLCAGASCCSIVFSAVTQLCRVGNHPMVGTGVLMHSHWWVYSIEAVAGCSCLCVSQGFM